MVGNLSPIALTVGPDGRVVVTKNGGPIRADSLAGQMATKIFGPDVELPSGRGSNYSRILDNIANRHAEARGIQAFLTGNSEAYFNETVKQACSHNSCVRCGDKQKTHGIYNVTGVVGQRGVVTIGREYVENLWE